MIGMGWMVAPVLGRGALDDGQKWNAGVVQGCTSIETCGELKAMLPRFDSAKVLCEACKHMYVHAVYVLRKDWNRLLPP